MRKVLAACLLCLCSTAARADGPFSWTGLYIGAHAGYGWGNVDVRQTNGGMPLGPFSYENTALLGGVTLGYNQQIDRIVVGAELDLGYMDLDGEGRIASSVPTKYQRIWTDGGLYAMATGRLGVTIQPRTLLYGKGGVVWFDGEAGQKTTNPGFKTFMADGFNGTVYGGGVEHAFTDRLSVKVEYLRLDFGSVDGYQLSVTDPPIGFKYTNRHDLTFDSVRIGVNYKLGTSD